MEKSPIILKDEMVLAAMDGRKTQVCIPLNPQPWLNQGGGLCWKPCSGVAFYNAHDTHDWHWHCKHGLKPLKGFNRPGTILWIKETWTHVYWKNQFKEYVYKADPKWRNEPEVRWSSSTQMPYAACRLQLEILDINVVRVQELTEQDAIAQGVSKNCPIGYIPAYLDSPYLYSYAQHWDLNNKRHTWDSNPWVWKIDFKKIEETK